MVDSKLMDDLFIAAHKLLGEERFKEALEGFSHLAEKGHAISCHFLAWMYEDAIGVEADLSLAFKYYRIAAENNVAPAQLAMGQMYQNGEVIEQDFVQAYVWYSRCCETSRIDPNQECGANEDLAKLIKMMDSVQLVRAESLIGAIPSASK